MEYIALLILTAVFSVCDAGDWCGHSRTYCSDGCCGYYYDEHCCADFLTIGAIVGIVIGGLITITGVVVIIVCVVCKPCNKGSRGSVIAPRPVHHGGVAVVSSGVTTTQVYPQYQQYPAGMQPMPPQPVPMQTYPPIPQDPAYPPPPPTYQVTDPATATPAYTAQPPPGNT